MNQQNAIPSAFLRKGVTTRSQDNLAKTGKNMQTNKGVNIPAKRKAHESPSKGKTTTKRAAFGDLTNNTGKSNISINGKKVNGKVQSLVKGKFSGDKQNIKPSIKLADIIANTRPTTKPAGGKVLACITNVAPRRSVAKIGKASAPATATVGVSTAAKATAGQNKTSTSPIGTSETTDSSTLSENSTFLSSGSSSSSDNTFPADVVFPKRELRCSPAPVIPRVPANVIDFDRENLHDPCQVSVYAMDIFNYMRSREPTFKVRNYMSSQLCLTANMRALLVDWMVEVQETFELNHETLYLAVKLVDLYLSKITVAKETLQLIGAAAIFIASKFDERMPPLIDDFIYICDKAYDRDEIIKAEMNVVKLIGFDLGMPLSYRFLRRFARCAKVTMIVLTLARYVLETSLMHYAFVMNSESKMAAAALYLALRMKDVSEWTPTLVYYTSYGASDLQAYVTQLNMMLHRQPRDQLSTVRNKYSHKIFFEVAKTPLLTNEELLSSLK